MKCLDSFAYLQSYVRVLASCLVHCGYNSDGVAVDPLRAMADENHAADIVAVFGDGAHGEAQFVVVPPAPSADDIYDIFHT